MKTSIFGAIISTIVCLTFLVSCTASDLSNAQTAARDTQQVSSSASLPSSTPPAIQPAHQLVQSIGSSVPWGDAALALVVAIAGAAGTIIQTVRKNQTVSAHQQAIRELTAAIPPPSSTALAATKSRTTHTVVMDALAG